MSELKKGDNPCPYIADMIPDEKGRVTIPPEKYTIAVGPLDVRNNQIKLTGSNKYSFKEIDGQVYRVQNGVVIGPPINKEKFEAIRKLHEEFIGSKDDDKEI